MFSSLYAFSSLSDGLLTTHPFLYKNVPLSVFFTEIPTKSAFKIDEHCAAGRSLCDAYIQGCGKEEILALAHVA